jgi:hypothetical protein
MTAPECRPPPGTPDGAVCVLEIDVDENADVGPIRIIAVWRERPWWRGGCYFENNMTRKKTMSVRRITRLGWRFHSLATPPEAPE